MMKSKVVFVTVELLSDLPKENVNALPLISTYQDYIDKKMAAMLARRPTCLKNFVFSYAISLR